MHESQTRQPHPFAFTGEEDVPPAVPSKDGSARKPSPKKAAVSSIARNIRGTLELTRRPS